MMKISHIEKDSLAEKCGLTNNYFIVSLNGYPIVDLLDIMFLESLEKIDIVAENSKGKRENFFIKNDFETSIGIEIDDKHNLTPIQCENHCLFCFVKQLPLNMRESLYIKDDDYRLSMISGSYITLTNLTDSDIERIIRMKISPLYISVHAFDNDVRVKLLANKKAVNTIKIMKRLLDAGIQMHTQIVVCEGINDGKILEDTVTKLHDLSDNILSCAVIPVGLTKYRCGLPKLNLISASNARKIIDFLEKTHKVYAQNGSGFVWASDEMYLIAGNTLPNYEYYEDFNQLENGIGLLAQFDEDFNESLKELEESNIKEVILEIEKYIKYEKQQIHLHRIQDNINNYDESAQQVAEEETEFGKITHIAPAYALVTGISFAPILKKYALKLEHISHIGCNVYAIVNDYFGESVTVAGLITATDLIKQLKGKITETRMIIPSVMLREFTTTFLDGLSVEDVEKELNVKIFVSTSAGDIIKIVTGDNFDFGTYTEDDTAKN